MTTQFEHETFFLVEDGYQAKSIYLPTDLIKSYALRYQIFVNELNWVPANKKEVEIDRYDKGQTIPIGVFDANGEIAAYLRITRPGQLFMMEEVWPELLNKPIVKTRKTVEVSRVCVAAAYRKKKIRTEFGQYFISLFLYKGLYTWSRSNNVDELCMVIEYKLYRLLKMTGFPCQLLGDPKIMEDGVKAVAVVVNWLEFEHSSTTTNNLFLTWFMNMRNFDIAI